MTHVVREHKGWFLAAIALAGAIVNFLSVPSWASWLGFGVFITTSITLVGMALAARTRLVRHHEESDVSAGDAALYMNFADAVNPSDR
jgi:hypothetical protein